MLQAQLKEKSKKRRQLLAQQLGVSSDAELSLALGTSIDKKRTTNSRTGEGTSGYHKKDELGHNDHSELTFTKKIKGNRSPQRDQDKQNSSLTTKMYKDSSTFLKGTQSENPHNDYCQHFVDTGHRPQNFIRDVGLADRFEEYPKLKELIKLKDELIAQTACPPMYLKADLKRNFHLGDLKGKFDVILVEPPLEEYQRGALPTNSDPSQAFWSWDEIMALPVEEIAAQRGFVFLFVGSSEGLDLGRNCLRKWGFRRCEDICWIKTNAKSPGKSSKNALDPKAIFQRTKQHCLMGIKGTVRRSTDGDFIHANVDIDLIITEEPAFGDIEKPEEIFHIIEHFCLGRRRLHIFGRDATIRPGWLTIGPHLANSNFNSDAYWNFFDGTNGHLTGCTERIEALRPKSPPPKNKNLGAGNRGAGNARNHNRR